MLGKLWRGDLPAIPAGNDAFVPLVDAGYLARLMRVGANDPASIGVEHFVRVRGRVGEARARRERRAVHHVEREVGVRAAEVVQRVVGNR